MENLASAISCFVSLFGVHTGNTRPHHQCNWAKQGMIIIHRLNKLLTCLQAESLLFIEQTTRNNPIADLLFSEILRMVTLLIYSCCSRIQKSFDCQLKSFPELFWSCQVFERLLIVHCIRDLRDFHCRPEFLRTFENPCTRENVVTKSLFYQLENFSSWFARLETKVSSRSLLYLYELSQRSTRYRILNTTEHERKKRSDWHC
jgi:hypothetical protein